MDHHDIRTLNNLVIYNNIMTRKHKYKKKNSPTYSYSKFDLGHKDLILI